MKILKIRLKNLNSLRGENEIDFTREPLAGAGLFAITGPTGAGKSTILDAITLALYGRAARYGDNARPEFVMSRHASECYAEVEFSCAKGSFRSRWSLKLKKSRKTDDGDDRETDDPKRSIASLPSGEILPSKGRECSKTIEDLIGLDYRRFMRSVLLSQGNFAEFLRADKNEKAELLQRITGTEIYGEISRKSFEIAKESNAALEKLGTALDGIPILSDEEKSAKITARDNAAKETDAAKSSADALRERIGEAQKWAACDDDSMKIASDREILDREKAENTGDMSRLAAHEKAVVFGSAINSIDHETGELSREKEEWTVCVKTMTQKGADAKRSLKTALGAAKTVQRMTNDALSKIEDNVRLNALWLESNASDAALDSKLSEIAKKLEAVENAEKSATETAKTFDEAKKESDSLAASAFEAEAKIKPLENASIEADKIAENRKAEKNALLGDETIENLRARERTLAGLESEIEKAIDLITRVTKLRADLVESSKKTTDKTSRLTLLDESRKTLKSAEETAAELVEARIKLLKTAEKHLTYAGDLALLEDGAPCPLCGSTVHPFKTDAPPPEEVKMARRDLADAKKKYDLAKTAFDQADRAYSRLAAEKDAGASESKRILDGIEDLEKPLDELLTNLGIPGNSDAGTIKEIGGNTRMTREALKLRIEKLEATQKAIDSAEKDARDAKSRLVTASAALEKAKALADQAARKADAFRDKSDSAAKKIPESMAAFNDAAKAFGDECVDLQSAREIFDRLDKRRTEYAARKKLETVLSSDAASSRDRLDRASGALAEARKSAAEFALPEEDSGEAETSGADVEKLALRRDKVLSEVREIRVEIDRIERDIKRLESSTTDRETRIEAMRNVLLPKLLEAGFLSEDALRSAILERKDSERIAATRKHLDERETDLSARVKSVALRRRSLKNTANDDAANLPTLLSEMKNLDARRDDLNRLLGEIDTTLKNDEASHDRRSQLSTKIDAARIESGKWNRLAALIGSADGAKFSRFAQSLSLDRLTSLANRHLFSLNPRYLVRRKKADETKLDLEIVDCDQADAVRPVESLSGGETFLVSLALALALSQLAGKNAPIESLFIDEGFGSLDSEALEAAMEALDNLQAGGRTIGVISHVEAMKERIGRQIRVIKEASGRSRIEVVG